MPNEIDPSGVQIVGQVDPADVSAGRGNGALALAGALQEAAPELNDFIGQVSQKYQAASSAKAQADAFATSGQAFADAVRSGKIEPTQNPWYMRAYNAAAGEIQGRALMTQTLEDSQTWAERNDPVAYQKKLQDVMGQHAQAFASNPAALEGFEKGATPVYQAAVSSNTEQNVQQINLAHVQNTTTQMEQAMSDYRVAHPTAPLQDVLKAVDPIVAQWKGTGGNDAEARELVFNSITGLAYNTHDQSLLDLANVPYQGGSPLSQIADATGKPYGAQLADASFRIERDSHLSTNYATSMAQAKVTAEGNTLASALMTQYGLKAIQHTSPDEISAIATKMGVSSEGALAAMDILATKFEKYTGLEKAMVTFSQMDPANVTKVVDYHAYAALNGLTKDLVSRLKTDVATHGITQEQADTVIGEGASTNRTKFSESMANHRQDLADENEARASVRDTKNHIADYSEQITDGVVFKAEHMGDHYFTTGQGATTNRANLKARVNGAVGAWLSVHPDDVSGAQAQARQEAAAVLQERIRAHAHVAPGGAGLGEKPN